MTKPTKKLEDNNIRSIDLFSGEAILRYLDGRISKPELRKELIGRKKEMVTCIKGIDKALKILTVCPKYVKDEECDKR